MSKLKIMCARSMHQVVTALAYDFTSATGNEVELSFGTVGALQQRLDAGETADVVISGKPAIDALDKAGRLAPKSRWPYWEASQSGRAGSTHGRSSTTMMNGPGWTSCARAAGTGSTAIRPTGLKRPGPKHSVPSIAWPWPMARVR